MRQAARFVDRRRVEPSPWEATLHIFIDESGTFTGVGADAPAVSTLGALILASHRLPKLFRKYERLRVNLPKNRKGEVKGSKLNEAQVAAVVELLWKNGAIFCASMIDLAGHTVEEIAGHRERRGSSLAANLTDGLDGLRRPDNGSKRRPGH